jgi:hypothetical protein
VIPVKLPGVPVCPSTVLQPKPPFTYKLGTQKFDTE